MILDVPVFTLIHFFPVVKSNSWGSFITSVDVWSLCDVKCSYTEFSFAYPISTTTRTSKVIHNRTFEYFFGSNSTRVLDISGSLDFKIPHLWYIWTYTFLLLVSPVDSSYILLCSWKLPPWQLLLTSQHSRSTHWRCPHKKSDKCSKAFLFSLEDLLAHLCVRV